MAKLYIRDRSCGYITFLHSKQELTEFIENYIPGRPLVIGDLSQFNSGMKQMLLKFIEENPIINCYSSEDPVDGILQSRFIEILKQPVVLASNHDVTAYLSSDRSYQSALNCLSGVSNSIKLRAPLCRNQIIKFLLKNQ